MEVSFFIKLTDNNEIRINKDCSIPGSYDWLYFKFFFKKIANKPAIDDN